MMLRVTLPVGALRFLFLQVSTVRQQYAAQVQGRGCAEHGPTKAVAREERQVASVIEVRVRQYARIDFGRAHRQRRPVTQPEVLQPLEQAAVEEDPAGARL